MRQLPAQVARQILEAHSSMLNMSLTDAKMQYIRNWQALGDFGITYFVIRVGRSRKDVSSVTLHTCFTSIQFDCY